MDEAQIEELDVIVKRLIEDVKVTAAALTVAVEEAQVAEYIDDWREFYEYKAMLQERGD